MASFMYEDIELEDDNQRAPCKCCRLDLGIDLPIPKPLTLGEVHELALDFSHTIFKDFTKLNAVLKRFEAVMRKRWMRKSNKQRHELLLTGWPGMSKTHRPDFEHYRNLKRSRVARSKTCDSNAFLWPNINLEDLAQGHLMLLFLNSRGRNHPAVFANHDMESAHLGWGWAEATGAGNATTGMVFRKQNTPRSYGHFCTVDSLPLGVGRLEFYDIKLGLLCLEIQAGAYSFLLRCAKLLLHDIDENLFCLAPSQIVPPTLSTSHACWESVFAHTLEAPYRVPHTFDLDRLRLLVSARRSAAEDHVWSMREDPGYFMDTIDECEEHLAYRLLERNKDDVQHDTAQTIADALQALYMWSIIDLLLRMMRPVDEQLRLANPNTMLLCPWDEFIWMFLVQVIDALTARPIAYLKTAIPLSPSMRRCYHPAHRKGDCPLTCHGNCESLWNMKSGCTRAELRVDRIFNSLVDQDNRDMHGSRQLVEEVQYMLDSDPEANELIDPFVMALFADLAVLSDVQHRIFSLNPYSDRWNSPCAISHNWLARGCTRLFNRLAIMMKYLCAEACVKSTTLRKPLKDIFNYPVTKRRTRETVTQMRNAELALDHFWMALQQHMESNGLNLELVIEWWTEKDFNFIQFTPKWKEPTPKPMLTPGPKHPAYVENTPDMFATPTSDNKKARIALRTRLKPKTHGLAGNSLTAVEVLMPPTPPESPPPASKIIKLPRRVFKVFDALLPTGIGSAREISWDDFIYAFNAVGLVPEKLYGSVWIFKPLPPGEGLVNVSRSIQFHEPKQVRRGSKIPAMMVKRLGRRLKRAFGWEGGLFECE